MGFARDGWTARYNMDYLNVSCFPSYSRTLVCGGNGNFSGADGLYILLLFIHRFDGISVLS